LESIRRTPDFEDGSVAFGLFLLLLALPVVEIALFIVVGGRIGVLATVGLVILAAFAGLAVIRTQGISTLSRLDREVRQGRDPVGPLADGALRLIAGLLLFIPGFLTDAAGLLLLVPGVRRALIRRGAARMTVQATAFARSRRPGGGPPPEIIDAEYEVIDDDVPPGSDGPRPDGSGWTRRP
jgi:UPF0716 protein FxsA